MPGQIFEILLNLSHEQDGHFTAHQAAAVGVSPVLLNQMVRNNTLERTSIGVYRLTAFPVTDRAQLWEAVLWPSIRGAEPAVLSHETALATFGVSDLNPRKVHITLPESRRTRRARPKFLVIHFEDLGSKETIRFQRLPITTVERAITDCIADGVSLAVLRQAVDEALAQGLLDRSALRNLNLELGR